MGTYVEKRLSEEITDKEEYETTIAGGEKITYVLSEGDNLKRLHFIKNGYEIMIIEETDDSFDMKFINNLYLEEIPIKERTISPGYGDVLIAKNNIEVYYKDPITQFDQREMKTLEQARKSVQKQWIERTINSWGVKDVSYEIVNETFIPAVAGTADDPTGGTDGSYTFQVKLSKNETKQEITDILTATIKATEFIGIDEFEKEGNRVTIKAVQKSEETSSLLIVSYQGNMMLEMKSQKITGSKTVSVDIPENTDKIKAFFWGDMDYITTDPLDLFLITIVPKSEAWELTKNEQGEWE